MRLKTYLLAAGVTAFALFGASPAFAADDPAEPPLPADCVAAPPEETADSVAPEPTESAEDSVSADPTNSAEGIPCEESGSLEPNPSPEPGAGAPPAPAVERDPNYTG
ncbi:hypothetical protein ACFWTE_19000 [Nocardiopsis sp. NPDC058631]|uniref:hypothetical protein n=1 Tax=Nocardiopsis sp. NPDC058631 TaxID=3346566 RepID=UPI00366485C1